jgi:hypothetical protein
MDIERSASQKPVDEVQVEEVSSFPSDKDIATIEHVEGEIWSGVNRQTVLAFLVSCHYSASPACPDNVKGYSWPAECI